MTKYPASIANPDQENHELTIYITEGAKGQYVGHLKEVPEIIVQAPTEDKLEDEATISVNLLWSEFPEMHDKLFPTHPHAIKGGRVIAETAQYVRIPKQRKS